MATQSSRIRRLGTPEGRGRGTRGAVVALLLAAGLMLPACDSGESDAGPVLTAGDFRTPGAETPKAENGKGTGTIKPTTQRSPLAGALTPNAPPTATATQPIMPPGAEPVTMTPEAASQGVSDVAVLVGDRENKGDP